MISITPSNRKTSFNIEHVKDGYVHYPHWSPSRFCRGCKRFQYRESVTMTLPRRWDLQWTNQQIQIERNLFGVMKYLHFCLRWTKRIYTNRTSDNVNWKQPNPILNHQWECRNILINQMSGICWKARTIECVIKYQLIVHVLWLNLYTHISLCKPIHTTKKS